MDGGPRYDVCLSFASEQAPYVRAVHAALSKKGVHCFFAEQRQVDLWGRDLAEHFDSVFRSEAAYCVAFISGEWVEKTWPTHERRSALARSVVDSGYFLPVRFDDTPVPGLRPTVSYVDATVVGPDDLAEMIEEKVASRERSKYLPPYPNRLYAALELEPGDFAARDRVNRQAIDFLGTLEELDSDERRFVVDVLRYGCPCDLPVEAHILVDRLCRVGEWTPEQVHRVIKTLNVVPGFKCGYESSDGPKETVRLQWSPMSVGSPEGPATGTAVAMIQEAGTGSCLGCYERALARLDFSRTSSLLDRSEQCDLPSPGEYPSELQPLIDVALSAEWVLETVPDQVRLREPSSDDFVSVTLFDRHDSECVAWTEQRLRHLLEVGGLDLTGVSAAV